MAGDERRKNKSTPNENMNTIAYNVKTQAAYQQFFLKCVFCFELIKVKFKNFMGMWIFLSAKFATSQLALPTGG